MKMKNICVIGLGYVGLTLAVVLAEKGFRVLGIERREEITDILKKGKAHFYEKNLDMLLKKYLNKNLFIYNGIPDDQEIDAFVIAVGTPVDEQRKPDLQFVIDTIETVSQKLREGQTIILRSTVPIGTSREVVYPLLAKSGKGFYLAFCPERTTEGKALEELRTLPQIIGGYDSESVDRANDIFRKVTCTTIEVESLETAEMNKIIDNTYRDLVFAYANEMSLICKKLGLNGNKVIEAANLSYPRTDIPIPGFVGGTCLLKDPWIFIDCVRKKTGYIPKLTKAAREINEDLTRHVLVRLVKYLEENDIPKKKVNLFISGLTFKGNPDNDDLRGSSSVDLLEKLKKSGFGNIYGHDFNLTEKTIKELGLKPCSLEKGFRDADIVLIMNNNYRYHNLDIERLIGLMKTGALFYDSWHIYDPGLIRDLNLVSYESLSYKTR